MIYDEDEDNESNSSSDESEDDDDEEWAFESEDELDSSQLYNTKLDDVDEILFFRDALNNLSTAAPDHYKAVVSCLSPD